MSDIDKGDKYQRTITNDVGSWANVDVYDVLRAFKITDPALAHGLKKLLCAGERGNKGLVQDIEEGLNSVNKYLQHVNAGT